jgi:hypothetical protein
LHPRPSVHVDAATASAVCLALGRRDEAIAWIEIGLREPGERKAAGMMRIDPRLTALRADQRFEALFARTV